MLIAAEGRFTTEAVWKRQICMITPCQRVRKRRG